VVLAAVASRTEHIRLGSAVTVLSSDDPVRVYQRFSTLNALSNGRAEGIVGRGSFTESFPLFGFELSDYNLLFEERLELFAALVSGKPVTWSGRTRAALRAQAVYPPVESGRLMTWVGVGRDARVGDPRGPARAPADARHHRRQPAALRELRRSLHAHPRAVRTLEQYGRGALPIGAHSPGHVARSDEQAREELWPHYAAMMTRIGAERGWPPVTRAQFDREAGPDGALCVGSPKTVAAKIASTIRALRLSRFDMKYSNGTLPQHPDDEHRALRHTGIAAGGAAAGRSLT
jgi:alkanesulfonate monooxygenase SsuD/methylene tetrahydromethanopterin reductase-like flavin-dependent oxidoreductase (luciferase family)